ncbi:MAG: heme lyase CcmF/NrfE family subunit [Pseudomonadota bacterium]|nr:heme lyase CcmF/NrfE family subunit [Pseudomonadota bacterium]
MTGELGQLALCLALVLSLIQAGAGIAGARPVAARARSVASGAALGFFVFVIVAFGALVYASVVSDFSLLNVAQNSSTTKPLLYKLTGVWGNHEGSMLLWVTVLAIYTLAMVFAKRGGERLTSAALGVQGLLALAFVLFILFTSNPFLRIDPAPFQGAGLNPLLQDPGLALHPPMLYIGYVGLSAAFSYAAAALITMQADADWARAARPFILVAWITLTLGITLGSWWAYYELGWGGFWFWDPVENASLMPWLLATALLHSALATERTGAFRTWTLLLAIGGFSLSLIGTFLVRSGVLSSVHSFASDPKRGMFILMMLVAAIGSALALFAWRAPQLEEGAAFEPVSKETTFLINNVFLVAACATVFIGTIYPLALDAFNGTKISVGPPFFAITFAPIFVALMILVPFGPQLGWRRGNLHEAVRTLMPALGLAAVAGVIVLAVARPFSLAAAGAFLLAFWVIGASALDIWRRGRGKFRALPLSAYASALAHAGLGITLLGIVGTTVWKSEMITVLKPGQSATVGGYTLRLDKVVDVQGPNYIAQRAVIDVFEGGKLIATMNPEKRMFPTMGQTVSDTAIRTTGFEDLYLALGDQRGAGWTVRAYANPLAPFIWFGGIFMALGGFASLWTRLRVKARAPSANTVPAE